MPSSIAPQSGSKQTSHGRGILFIRRRPTTWPSTTSAMGPFASFRLPGRAGARERCLPFRRPDFCIVGTVVKGLREISLTSRIEISMTSAQFDLIGYGCAQFCIAVGQIASSDTGDVGHCTRASSRGTSALEKRADAGKDGFQRLQNISIHILSMVLTQPLRECSLQRLLHSHSLHFDTFFSFINLVSTLLNICLFSFCETTHYRRLCTAN